MATVTLMAMINQMPEGPEKAIKKDLEKIALSKNEGAPLDQKLSDAFFFYLNALNAEKPIS